MHGYADERLVNTLVFALSVAMQGTSLWEGCRRNSEAIQKPCRWDGEDCSKKSAWRH